MTVRYDDTDLQITIGGAQSQPGAGWRIVINAEPNLVIAATLRQTGAQPSASPFRSSYWSFTPDDGSPEVTLNIISGFEPSIVTAR